MLNNCLNRSNTTEFFFKNARMKDAFREKGLGSSEAIALTLLLMEPSPKCPAMLSFTPASYRQESCGGLLSQPAFC